MTTDMATTTNAPNGKAQHLAQVFCETYFDPDGTPSEDGDIAQWLGVVHGMCQDRTINDCAREAVAFLPSSEPGAASTFMRAVYDACDAVLWHGDPVIVAPDESGVDRPLVPIMTGMTVLGPPEIVDPFWAQHAGDVAQALMSFLNQQGVVSGASSVAMQGLFTTNSLLRMSAQDRADLATEMWEDGVGPVTQHAVDITEGDELDEWMAIRHAAVGISMSPDDVTRWMAWSAMVWDDEDAQEALERTWPVFLAKAIPNIPEEVIIEPVFPGITEMLMDGVRLQVIHSHTVTDMHSQGDDFEVAVGDDVATHDWHVVFRSKGEIVSAFTVDKNMQQLMTREEFDTMVTSTVDDDRHEERDPDISALPKVGTPPRRLH